MIRSDPRERPTADDRFGTMERGPTTTPKKIKDDRLMSKRIKEPLTELEKGYIEEEN
ncbi:hypothetical protein PPACK8108_LOCUS12694, partial [Phakopsora pachyrhizi]